MKNPNPKIIITASGSGGHVCPALTLAKRAQQKGVEVLFVGTEKEKEAVENAGVDFVAIRAGKLRRYWAPKENVRDMFRTFMGIFDALKIIRKFKRKPVAVFSKGGFASVPVVTAARLKGIKILAHESDQTLGLANKVAKAMGAKIFIGPKNGQFVDDIFTVQEQEEKRIFVTCGSQGSVRVNKIFYSIVPKLLEQGWKIIHQTGASWQADPKQNYQPQDFFSRQQMADQMTKASVIVSRAGAQAIAEMQAVGAKAILIPLPKAVSRGDQIDNAKKAQKQGWATVIEEKDLNPQKLLKAINQSHSLNRAPKGKDASEEVLKTLSKGSKPKKTSRFLKLFRWGLTMAVLVLLFTWWANRAVSTSTQGVIKNKPEELKQAQAVLSLGALVYNNGQMSHIFYDRTQTALEVYQSGKAQKILVSGDHGQANYDEVNAAKNYLIEQGIKPEDIFLDHAGFDTYDSLYRAKEIFQVQSLIISTQDFHLPRAVYICQKLGLTCQGIKADKRVYWGARRNAWREKLARVKAYIDVKLNSKPKYLGDPIPIDDDGRESWD